MTKKVKVDTSQLVILWVTGTNYSVNIDPGFVQEQNNNRSLSAEQINSYTFTTPGLPVRTGFTPSTNSTDIVNPQFTFTFDQLIIKNSGNFYLFKVGSPDLLIDTISVEDLRVSISDYTITLDMSSNSDLFVGGESYYILYDAGIVKNNFNFLVYALDDPSIVRFTYRTKPTIASVTPTLNTTGTFITTVSITFNRSMQKGSGNLYLYKESNPDILYSIIPVSTSSVTVSGSTATISLPALSEDIYYLIYNYGVFKDTNNIKVAAVSDNSVVRFTQAITTNLTNRNYYANSENTFFSNAIPTILDTDTTSSYTITLSNTLGEFANDSYGAQRGLTWSYTGTKSQITSMFSNIRYFPTRNLLSGGTYTYTQVKNGLTQVNKTLNITGLAQVTPLSTSTNIFTSNGTFTPLYKYVKYGVADILVVGGGGGGSGSTRETFGNGVSLGHGAAGGAGGVIEILNSTITQKTYTFTVGIGGTAGTAGIDNYTAGGDGGNASSSTFDIYTANGGFKGIATKFYNGFLTTPPTGGNSGAPTTHLGFGSKTVNGGGGGGAGSNSTGTDGGVGLLSQILNQYVAVGGSVGEMSATTSTYGSGGSGVYSNIINGRVGFAGQNGVVVVRQHPEDLPVTFIGLTLSTSTFVKFNQDGSLNTDSISASLSVRGVYSNNIPDGQIRLSDNIAGTISNITLNTTTNVTTATYTWNPISVSTSSGIRSISASYLGDGFNLPNTATQTITIIDTIGIETSTVSHTSYNDYYANPLTVSVNLGSAIYNGTAVLKEGNTVLGTATRNQSTITFSAITLSTGTHNLTVILPANGIYQEKVLSYSLTRLALPTTVIQGMSFNPATSNSPYTGPNSPNPYNGTIGGSGGWSVAIDGTVSSTSFEYQINTMALLDPSITVNKSLTVDFYLLSRDFSGGTIVGSLYTGHSQTVTNENNINFNFTPRPATGGATGYRGYRWVIRYAGDSYLNSSQFVIDQWQHAL